MSSNPEKIPLPSFRFLLEIFLLSSALGLILLAFHGPILLFYLAPLLFVPLMIHRLRAIDSEQRGRPGESGIERKATGPRSSK
jgi:hypothetical protein